MTDGLAVLVRVGIVWGRWRVAVKHGSVCVGTMGWKLSELFYLQSHGHSLGSYMGRIVYTRHLTCIPQLISHQYNQLQSKW